MREEEIKAAVEASPLLGGLQSTGFRYAGKILS